MIEKTESEIEKIECKYREVVEEFEITRVEASEVPTNAGIPTLKIALVAELTLKISSLENHTPVDCIGFPSRWVKTAFSTPLSCFIWSKWIPILSFRCIINLKFSY